MRKRWMAAMAVLLLGISGGWAQAPAYLRKHSRPPYSGPRKARKGPSKERPGVHNVTNSKPGGFHPATPKSSRGMAQ